MNFKLLHLDQAHDGAGVPAGINDQHNAFAVNQSITTTNGQTFIREIQVECNGISL